MVNGLFISQPLAKYLDQTLILLPFTDCDFIYDGCSKTNPNELQVARNSLLRAIKRCQIDKPNSMVMVRMQVVNVAPNFALAKYAIMAT